MQKNTKRLLLGGFAAAFLGVACLLLMQLPEAKKTDLEPKAMTFISFNAMEIARLQVTGTASDFILTLTHGEDNSTAYVMSGDIPQIDYNKNLMENLIDTVCSLSARPVEEHCSNPAQYGLKQPAYTMTITDTQGTEITLQLGLTSSIVNGTYCSRKGTDAVYLLDTDTASILQQAQTDYRNLSILGSYYSISDELKELTISSMADGTEVMLSARDTSALSGSAIDAYSKFVLTKPIACDADDTRLINGILSDLQSGLTANGIAADAPKSLKAYGLEHPTATLHIVTNGAEAELLVGTPDADGSIYVMKTGQDTVYICDAEDYAFLQEDWSDWRSSNVMPCALSELQSIAIQQQDTLQTISIVKDTDDTGETRYLGMCDGTEMTETALQQLYLAVSSVHAIRWLPAPEEADAEIIITLTMQDASERTLAFAKGENREYLVNVNDTGYLAVIAQDDLNSILRSS